jgi:hypothetical protein
MNDDGQMECGVDTGHGVPMKWEFGKEILVCAYACWLAGSYVI